MKRFPAKILLFGEYGLLYGAKALALPFHAFGGQLQVGKKIPQLETKAYSSYLEIDRFYSFFDFHGLNKEMNYPLELKRLKKDLDQGLYFESDIPLEYGVGSSGALCAAIFDEYSLYHEQFSEVSRNKDVLESLKRDFSVLERYFHGSSSGIDPLVVFLDRPIVVENGQVSIVDLPNMSNYSIHLIDTKEKSPTSPLVEQFKNKMKDSAFSDRFMNDYISLNNQLVDLCLHDQPTTLFDSLQKLITHQFDFFSEMIPANFHKLLISNLKQGIPIKLLGSGGGGFLLAFIPKGKMLDFNGFSLKFS